MKEVVLQTLAFVHRDIVVFKQRLMRFLVNYAFLYAIMYGLCFGYLLPKIGMGNASGLSSTIILVGLILFALNGLAFAINTDFLFDNDRDRFVEYQLTIVPYWLIIVEKIIFGSVVLFVSIAPYYLVMKLCYSSVFDLSHSRPLYAGVVLYLSCLMAMAFAVTFACFVKHPTRQIRHFYRRINFPAIILGGVLVPWRVMLLFSPLLGYLVLLNPLIYVTEGLRSSLIGGDYFLSFWICMPVLLTYAGIFTATSLYFFRRKADTI